MAMINCPECNKEISETCKKCPNCGYKKKRKINKKLIIIISLAILAIIIGGIITGVLIDNNKKKQEFQRESEYNELLIKTGAKMYLYGVVSQVYCYDIGKIWYNSIFEESDYTYNKYTKDSYGFYNSFSVSIANYQKEKSEQLTNLENAKSTISNDIKQLKDMPTEDYKNAYNALIDMYGVFSKLSELAISPSGSYNNYLSNYNKYSSDFTEAYNKLKVLLPDIENYELDEKIEN